MRRSNFSCCCRKLLAAGLVVSFFKVRCIRSCRPFCWGWRLRAVQCVAADQVAAREVSDGERIAVALVGEHELALVVRTPKIVRRGGSRERRTLCIVMALRGVGERTRDDSALDPGGGI